MAFYGNSAILTLRITIPFMVALFRLCIALLCTGSSQLAAQDLDWPAIIFKDRTNFRLTTILGNKQPGHYNLFDTTNSWNLYRFRLNEMLWNPFTRLRLERDEHHPYNHTYIFRDTMMDRIVLPREKEYLYNTAEKIQPRMIPKDGAVYNLISSFKAAPRGFLFSITSPVMSSDQQMAYIDITVYLKTKETTEINDSYFATILLIYQYSKEKGWTRIKKIDRLIL